MATDKQRAFFYSRLDGTRKKLDRYTVDELRGINLGYDEPWFKIRNLKKDQLITNIRSIKKYREDVGLTQKIIEKPPTIAEKIIAKKGQEEWTTDEFANSLFQELQGYGATVTSASEVPPGKLCFFTYGAKYPERYPWYDRRPLAYILEQKGDRMLGANFHYLRPEIRDIFIRRVLNKDDVVYGAMPKNTLHTYLHSPNTGPVWIIPEDMEEYIGIAQLQTWKFVNAQGLEYNNLESIWDAI